MFNTTMGKSIGYILADNGKTVEFWEGFNLDLKQLGKKLIEASQEIEMLRAALSHIRAQPASWTDSDELDSYIAATLGEKYPPT